MESTPAPTALDERRPAAWVDGNMHASELAGSSVALAIAEDAIRLHLEGAVHELAPPIVARLKGVRFFVLPRMSPDGAEAVLTTGRYVRSVPRDDRGPLGKSLWRSHDLDGDGRALVMRVEDPTGDYVANPAHPDLMSARRVDDAGPYYRVYPEGTIENWDGFTIPVPEFNGDNPVDLNRNFPWSWAPVPSDRWRRSRSRSAGGSAMRKPSQSAKVAHETLYPYAPYGRDASESIRSSQRRRSPAPPCTCRVRARVSRRRSRPGSWPARRHWPRPRPTSC